MQVHQVILGTSVPRVIAESAAQLRAALTHKGFDVSATSAVEIDRIADRGPRGVLVVYAGDERAPVVAQLCARRERIVLVCDGSWTGPGIDRSIDPLIERADACIATTPMVADELAAHGGRPATVVAPPIDRASLTATQSDAAFVDGFADHAPGRMILAVGPLVATERFELLTAAHHLVVRDVDPAARLVLAGPQPDADIAAAMVRYLRAINLDTVWLTGDVTKPQLAALYRRADVLVSVADGVGFPGGVFDAFRFGLPVVAVGPSARVAAGGALALPPTWGAPYLAEAVERVLRDGLLRGRLACAGGRIAAATQGDDDLDSMIEVVRGP